MYRIDKVHEVFDQISTKIDDHFDYPRESVVGLTGKNFFLHDMGKLCDLSEVFMEKTR